MWSRALILTILMAALSRHAVCASPENQGNFVPSAGEFVVSTWYGEGGLPHNVINDVVRDPRGFLWLGTQGGVARFDGRYFVNYSVPEEFAHGRHDIRALASEDERTMVMITGNGEIVRLRKGKFEHHPANAHVGGAVAVDLAVDESGALWIGTLAPVSLMRWKGGRMEKFGPDEGIALRSARFCIVPDGKQRTWIAGGDFLGWYDETGLHRYGPTPDRAMMIAKSHDGGLWIAGRAKLTKLEHGKCRTVLEGDDWPAARVGIQDIHETADGALWLATRRDGVLRLIDGKLVRLPGRHGRVESIKEDIDGNVWLGTHGDGLVRLKRKYHVLINSSMGMPNDISSSVTEDETGAMWFANQSGGPVRVKTGLTHVFTTPDGAVPFVSNICADQNGTVWVGTLNGLYSATVQTDSHTPVLRLREAGITNVNTLFCADNGDLWVSWRNGRLGRLRDGILREFAESEGWPGKRVAGIIERKGPLGPEIWGATQFGRLYKFAPDTERFDEQSLPDKIKNAQINALHADAENRLWLATSVGLLLWDDQTPLLFTRADGFPDDILYQVISGNHKRLWLSSRRGIFCVEIAELLDSKRTPPDVAEPAPVTLFGRDEHMEGLSGMVGGQPMTWKSRDGRLWFATYRGVVGFNAAEPSLNTAKKHPIYITGLAVNGDYIDIPSDTDNKNLRIGPGAGEVKFWFASLNFSSPERTQVRRMLEGFDVNWIDATGERSCVYSRLPPGKYKFHVEMADDEGPPNARSSLTIVIAAAWWQTGWFHFLAALLLVCAVAWMARHVSNRILRQRLRRLELEKALDHERTRIARDLHDELGSRISQMGFIANCVRRRSGDSREKKSLDTMVAQSHELVEDLHRIVWTVNPQNDSWQKLASYIFRYTQRILHDTHITCNIDGVDTIPDIPITPEVRHHLVAITKEALTNILKYAQADRIGMRMNVENGCFKLVISDNGCGFDPGKINTDESYGLENMRKRAVEVGGWIKIQSQPGNGTQITLGVSLQYRLPRNSENTS